MNEPHAPTCPNCESRDVTFKEKACLWECKTCETRFTPQIDHSHYLTGRTEHPKAIFFSYGHDENRLLVDDFKASLEHRGHTVWIDYKEIGTWSDWRGKITEGIHDSDLVLAFLSKHATRDPGVCRNEVAMALNRFGTLYPVLLESKNDVSPPVAISHLQWQDLSQWRDIRDGKVEGKDWSRWYEEKLIQIITLVEGEAHEFEGDINGLRAVLDPAKFTSDIASQIPDFVGREWVFAAYEDWLDNHPQSRVFWINAGPGVGKTAIAAMLAHTRQSAIVSAWFCQANSIERRSSQKALCSIAFQLATRWDDYRRKLRFQLGFNASTNADDWKELREALQKKNEADLFDFLFSEPLTGLIWRDHRLVILIDALDEASDADGQNPLVDLLVTKFATLPSWLNFVVTSRPNPEVVAKLQSFAPFELDTEDQRNREDLAVYLHTGLSKRAEFNSLLQVDQARIETYLLDNSEGMILYLQQILKGLDEGSIQLNTLEVTPKGLGSLYRIAFDHLYGGSKLVTVYDTEVKPLLELLIAAPDPLPSELTQQVLGWDKATYLRRKNRLGAYVQDTEQGSKLFHKTLSEWLIEESSPPYLIDAKPTQKVIAEYLWQCFVNTDDTYKLEWAEQTKYWLPQWMPLMKTWNDSNALESFGLFLHLHSSENIGEKFIQRAFELSEITYGSSSAEVASSLNSLAVLSVDKGDLDRAEVLNRKALAIQERVFGSVSKEVALSLNNLAGILRDKGQINKTEKLLRRALKIREKVLPQYDPFLANSLSNLAHYLSIKGETAEAERLFSRMLGICEQILRNDNQSLNYDMANYLHNYAVFLTDKGDYESAEPIFLRVLAINESILGKIDLKLGNSLDTLATFYENRGDYDKAEPFYRRKLEIIEKAAGLKDELLSFMLSESLCNLANLLSAAKGYEEAELLYRRALELDEKYYEMFPEKFEETHLLFSMLLDRKGDYEGGRRMRSSFTSLRNKRLELVATQFPEVSRKAKLFTYLFSKIVNFAMLIVGTFSKADQGDLEIIEYELLAISNFVEAKIILSINEHVKILKEIQDRNKLRISSSGIDIHNFDRESKHRIYLEAQKDAEKLIQDVHKIYRENVIWSKVWQD